MKLTPRQSEILRYIRETLDVKSMAPTVQEIQREFGFNSPNAAQSHLNALQKKGYIERSPNQARSIRLVNPSPLTGTYWRRAESGYRSKRLPKRVQPQLKEPELEEITTAPPAIVGKIIPKETAQPVAAGYEIGVDVFFNARHNTAGEFHGELHAHSWRLQAVVLMDADRFSPDEQVEMVRDSLLCVTTKLEATVLNDLDHFKSSEPCLKPVALYLASLVKAELAKVGARLLTTTLWDQPTQYITVREG